MKISNLSDRDFMNNLFPFYIVIDHKMEIKTFGRSIEKILDLKVGANFFDCFIIERPSKTNTFNGILKQKTSLFILQYKCGKKMKFRGQMYYEEKSNLICFIGGPLINSFDDLKGENLSLNDFALHDSTNQFLFTLQMQISAMKDTQKLADKLQVSNAKLKDINESLDSFIYKLTHDLRAPAINIHGMLKMLGEKMNPNKDSLTEKIYENSVKSTEKLLQTIDDFIELSRLTQESKRKPVRCNLKQILTDIKEEVSSTISSSNPDIKAEIEGFEEVYGIPDDIKSIFHNLITNSIKYCSKEKNPLIKISAKAAGKFTKYAITDNGLGIDMEGQKNKLFKIFSRLHSIPDIPGSGVGLFLVKQMVLKNGGLIELTSSTLNVGSTFTLYLHKPKD